MKKILIIGANSALALPCIKIWAKKDYSLFLVGRNEEKLKNLKNDLEKKYNINIQISVKNLINKKNCDELKDEYFRENNSLDILFICYGILGEQENLYLIMTL